MRALGHGCHVLNSLEGLVCWGGFTCLVTSRSCDSCGGMCWCGGVAGVGILNPWDHVFYRGYCMGGDTLGVGWTFCGIATAGVGGGGGPHGRIVASRGASWDGGLG